MSLRFYQKNENAVQIQQYRPIFTKVGTNHITEIAQKIIRPMQSAFMRGRHILEGVVVLHEAIDELHRKNMDGAIIKIDFEKGIRQSNIALSPTSIAYERFCTRMV